MMDTDKEITEIVVEDGPKKKEESTATVSRKAAIYTLTITALLNTVRVVTAFLLISLIFGMANEIEFGPTSCRVSNESAAQYYANQSHVSAREFCLESGRCDPNSSHYVPDACELFYTGRGFLYDVLVGPIYLLVPGLIILPLVGLIKRTHIRLRYIVFTIAFCSSLLTILNAFAQAYWAIALLRFLFGVISSLSSPFMDSYLSHIFPPSRQALVFGLAAYGGIAGYGLSYLFVRASHVLNWRWWYVVCGVAGIFIDCAFLFAVDPDNERHNSDKNNEEPDEKRNSAQTHGNICKGFQNGTVWSALIPVLLSLTIHVSSNMTFSYNLNYFLLLYYPGVETGVMITVTTLVAALPGCILGCTLADYMVKKYGVSGRIWLALTITVVGLFRPVVFVTPPPLTMLPYGVVIFIENWFLPLTTSTVSDLTPLRNKPFAFALNGFAASLGALGTLLVTPVVSTTDLPTALMILTGSLLAFSTLFLVLAGIIMQRRKQTLTISSGQENAAVDRKAS